MNRTHWLIAPLIAAALPLSGCAPASDLPIHVGAPVPAGMDTYLSVPTFVGGLTLTPLKVVEDSRCPAAAMCVWSGRVVVTTRVEGQGWRETTDIITGQPARVRDKAITLSQVTPAKPASGGIAARDYAFRFQVD